MLFFLAAVITQAASPSPACPAALTVAPGAPCPTLIFFDSSEADISRDAAAALDAVLANWRGGGFARVILDGHSDRSGPAPANQRMARLRAQAVATWLTERGLPSGSIEVRSMGEIQPVIATANGVREPQNRRVEVRLER
jgi:outer membrane protein OmpA-like peptidoglycan-associated protein